MKNPVQHLTRLATLTRHKAFIYALNAFLLIFHKLIFTFIDFAAKSGIDKIMISFLLILLLTKEYFSRRLKFKAIHQASDPEALGHLFNMGIIPLLYVFSYILLYRIRQFMP